MTSAKPVNLNTGLYIYLDYISSCYIGEVILDPDSCQSLCFLFSASFALYIGKHIPVFPSDLLLKILGGTGLRPVGRGRQQWVYNVWVPPSPTAAGRAWQGHLW